MGHGNMKASLYQKCTNPDLFGNLFTSDTRLEGMVFMTAANIGVMKCAQLCMVYVDCDSFNFQVQDGYCELNMARDSFHVGDLTNQINFIYGRKADLPKELLTSCKNHNCSTGSKCKITDKKQPYCQPIDRPNVALNKVTSQSSVFTIMPDCCASSHAVDGDIRGYLDNTCSITNFDDFNPWWQVDLGAGYFITGIEIFSANDTGSGDLRDIGIEILNLQVAGSKSCCRFVKGSLPTGPSVINCIRPVYGNVVKISLRDIQLLVICELRVFVDNGYQVYQTGNSPYSCFKTYGPNVAFGRPVTSSGIQTETGGQAQWLVDGQKQTFEFWGGLCVSASESNGLRWFQISLASNLTIQSVLIYNIADTAFPLNDLTITVRTSMTSPEQTCTSFLGPFGPTSRRLECDTLVTGQYVTIATTDDKLKLCEIEITVI